MDLDSCILSRRDTRHFLPDPVPNEVLLRALDAAHRAPSVGFSEPWRFIVVKSNPVKKEIANSFRSKFDDMKIWAENNISDIERRKLYSSLKLEAIEESPIGIGVFCERPHKDLNTIGTQGTSETLVWSCACAIQNLWLSLTSQGYSAGWVTILDFELLRRTLHAPANWEPLGYLCVGRPATDYGGKPMLEALGWKTRSESPHVRYL